MIGLDTNVLIRYIAQDDVIQSKKATALIENQLSEQHLGYITLITVIEIVWVLESCYSQKKAVLINIIESLVKTKQFLIERADIVHLALKAYKSGNGDFSDAVIVALCKDTGCTEIVTFEKKTLSVGMSKI